MDGLCPFVPMHGPTFCIVGVAGGQAQAQVPELSLSSWGIEVGMGKMVILGNENCGINRCRSINRPCSNDGP